MKRILTGQLVPGMKLAEDVINFSHQLLLAKGTILTDATIMMLDTHDVLSVRIDENYPPAKYNSTSETRSERIKNSSEFIIFKQQYDNDITNLRSSLNDVVERNLSLDVSALMSDTVSLLNSVHTGFGVFDMLHNMREYDDSTFTHCLNVSLICNVLARWLKMSEEDIQLATSAGLLHDIGKLLIPQEIIQKPDRLTAEEYNIIKKHPYAGYQLLKKNKVDPRICNAALLHHERCDGTGYPLGLTGDKTENFAKLVSIADVYDAMTAARVYRGPLCPFTVIDLFEKEGLQRYEPSYIITFLENVVQTYVSSECRLSNGEVGTILFINKECLSKPIVQCGTRYMNLATETDLSIVGLL